MAQRTQHLKFEKQATKLVEPVIERELPNVRVIERELLGALLLNNELLPQVAETLDFGDFFLHEHGKVFATMLTLAREQRPFDTFLLNETLGKKFMPDDGERLAFLDSLVRDMPTMSNVDEYVRRIREKSIDRNLIHLGLRLQEQGFSRNGDALDVGIVQSELAQFLENSRDQKQEAEENLLESPAETASKGEEMNLSHLAYPVVKGMVTLLDGMPKAAGKTTFILSQIAASRRQSLFLNQATNYGRVLYVTEEGRKTFATALRRAGLDAVETDFHILYNYKLHGWTWEKKVACIDRLCRELKIEWLVLDTFYKIANLGPEKEKDASTVSAAAEPVRQIAAQYNTAVELSRHERKSGGDVGQSGRGSNALDGDVDIIVRIQRLPRGPISQKRELAILSRIENKFMEIELTPEGEYRVSSESDIEDPFDTPLDQSRTPVTDMARVIEFVTANDPCSRAQIYKPKEQGGAGIKKQSALEAIRLAITQRRLFENFAGLITAQNPERPENAKC